MRIERKVTVQLEVGDPLQIALSDRRVTYLAARAGLAVSYVSQFISTQRPMPLPSAVKVCEAAGPEYVAMLQREVATAALRDAHPLKGVSE